MRKTIDEKPTLSMDAISDEKIRTLFTELTVEPIRADGKPTATHMLKVSLLAYVKLQSLDLSQN
jgi:hypothetical protein